MRTNLVTFALLLAGCAAEPVQVVGPYADRLSDAEIQQIKLAALEDSHEPLRKIEAIRRDKVRVETGTESRYTIFSVIKRSGRWLVDQSAGVEAVNKRPIMTY